MISRNSRLWDKQLEEGLPDCRVTEHRRDEHKIIKGSNAFDLIFCGSCSKPSDFMATNDTTFAFYLCNDCASKMAPQNAVEIPTPPGVIPASALQRP